MIDLRGTNYRVCDCVFGCKRCGGRGYYWTPRVAFERAWDRVRDWWDAWRDERYGYECTPCPCHSSRGCDRCDGDGYKYGPPGVLGMLRTEIRRLRRWIYHRNRYCDCGVRTIFGRPVGQHADDCIELLPF